MKFIKDLIKQKEQKIMGITGATDEFFCMYIAELSKQRKNPILIVTPTLFEANQMVSILSNYNENTTLFPMDDFLTSESIAISPDLKITRLETMNQIIEEKTSIVVTHLNGYLRYLPTKEKYKNSILSLTVGMEIKRDEQKLVMFVKL